jgi:hypothetical protein
MILEVSPLERSIVFNVNNPSIVLNKTIVVMNKMGSVATALDRSE